MSLEVEINQNKEYVEAIVSGEYDMQEAVEREGLQAIVTGNMNEAFEWLGAEKT